VTTMASDPYRAMLRGALAPALAVTLLALAASVPAGGRALAGSAVGSAIVLGFFGMTLLGMRAARNVAPEMLLGVAMALYSTKIAVIGALVFWLRGQSWLSPTALAATAIVCAVAWLAGQVVGFVRMRVFVADPGPTAGRR
jgi:ATP synthase protein I